MDCDGIVLLLHTLFELFNALFECTHARLRRRTRHRAIRYAPRNGLDVCITRVPDDAAWRPKRAVHCDVGDAPILPCESVRTTNVWPSGYVSALSMLAAAAVGSVARMIDVCSPRASDCVRTDVDVLARHPGHIGG